MRGARASSPARPCSSTTTTCISRRGSCASCVRTRRSSHFVHIPWPEPDAWRVLPDRVRRARSTRGCSRTTWSRSTRRAGASTSSQLVRGVRRRRSTSARRARFHPASVDPREFDALAESEAVLAAERALVAERPEFLVLRVDRTDPSKNVVRGFEAFARMLELHPELRGRVRMLALLDASRQEIPAYAAYLARDRARRRDAASGGWPTSTCGSRTTSPASVAAYKQFDVLLRELGHGRPQPGREGGAAREHPRRRRCLIGQHRSARGARVVDVQRRSVRRRGPGRGASTRRSRSPRRSGRRTSRRSASTFAGTTWTSGSTRSWPISTA